MNKIFSVFFGVLLLSIALAGEVSAQSADVVSAVSGSNSYSKDATFDVDINLNLPEAATAVKVYINYDPAKLTGKSIDTGVSAFTTVWPEATFDSASGLVKLQAGQKSPGISGSVTLARLTFTAKEAGDATLSLESTSLVLTADDRNQISSYGNILGLTITEPASPPPPAAPPPAAPPAPPSDSSEGSSSEGEGAGGSTGRACSKVGDANCDGQVNISDLSVLLANWKKSFAGADFDGNGIVDIGDLSKLLANWKK